MCLYSKTADPEYAKSNIKCYKFYCIYEDQLNLEHKSYIRIVSPYFPQFNIRSIPCLLDESDKTTVKSRRKIGIYEISEGAFHTYSSLLALFSFFIHNLNSIVIVECTIPKGTAYWEGENKDVYASKKLILNRILSPEDLYSILKEDVEPYEAHAYLQIYYNRYNNNKVKAFLLQNKKS